MTQPPAPAISVIVPMYNVADHIGACIASLRAQTRTDFQAIVVDDGSTDASPARLRAAIGDDARFHVITQTNRGLSAARNAALELARGDFIAFLDGDDRMAPDFLARMHAALTESGADWVACAIRMVHPDGPDTVHSAIHDAPEIADPATLRLIPLTDWREVIRHFPSAWNKLYRRSLIEGLRFDEGTYYEDHAFYARAAARAQAMAYLPEALILHSRDRPGQITGEDSERVFEQLDVLETLAGLIRDDGADSDATKSDTTKSGGAEAFERLAARLLVERAFSLRDPDRRARFAAAGADFLARHGLRHVSDDPTLSPAWGLEMQGRCPLSVIIPWDGQPGPLRVSLAALAAQTWHGFELLIVADDDATARAARAEADRATLGAITRTPVAPTPGPGAARNAGLDAARGELLVFLDAGDVPIPGALGHWADTMLRQGADFGASAFRIGIGAGAVHGGFHDMSVIDPPGDGPLVTRFSGQQALCLHAHPSAKVFRAEFLRTSGLRFGTGVLPEWQMVLGAALIAPVSVCFFHPWVEVSEHPPARRLWHRPASPHQLAGALDDLARALPEAATARLPPGWFKRLLGRAFWERYHFATPRRLARARFLARVWLLVRTRRLRRQAWQADPYLDPRLRRLLGNCNVPRPAR